jgi:hypothetical protein
MAVEFRTGRMPGLTQIRDYFQAASSNAARSSALAPLGWLATILVSGAAATSWAGAPDWLSGGLGVCGGLVAIPFCVAYFYFMRKNPDALRSERYFLQKLAIERGLVGDDRAGLYLPVVKRTPSERAVEVIPVEGQSLPALPEGKPEPSAIDAGDDDIPAEPPHEK